MALTIKHQTGCTASTVTAAIDQGSLPANFAEDRIYITTSEPLSEPSTPAFTLTSGGNTSLTFTSLENGRYYWITGWRHYNDATAPTRSTYDFSSSTTDNFHTLWTTYTPPVGSWTEDWSNGLRDWATENRFKCDHLTIRNDATMGNFLRVQTHTTASDEVAQWGNGYAAAYNRQWGGYSVLSRHAFSPSAAFSVSGKVRAQSSDGSHIGWGSVTLLTSQVEYLAIFWNFTSGQVGAWAFNEVTGVGMWTQYAASKYIGLNTAHTYNITYNGMGGWTFKWDGTQFATYSHVPAAPFVIWLGAVTSDAAPQSWWAASDYGPMTVTGEIVALGSADCGFNKFWDGSHSVQVGSEQSGTFASNSGGIVPPNADSQQVTPSRLSSTYGGPTPPLSLAGAFSASSPLVTVPNGRKWSSLTIRGKNQNGTALVRLKDSGGNLLDLTGNSAGFEIAASPVTVDLTGVSASSLRVQVDGTNNSNTLDPPIMQYATVLTEAGTLPPAFTATPDADSITLAYSGTPPFRIERRVV